MNDPVWVEEEIVLEAHRAALVDHGGAPGVLNQGSLQSALIRAQNRYHYGNPKPDIIDLAATYVHALCKAHAFNDGNKRTAFYVCRIFLMENGYTFDPPTEETVEFLTQVADDRNTGITDAHVAEWLCRFAIKNAQSDKG